MNQIIFKKQLSKDVFMMKIHAPLIAEERQAGQFIILQVDDDYGERIPLTIADANDNEGSITIIFQVVGKTTLALSELNVNDSLPALVGHWGNRRTLIILERLFA